MTKNLNDEKLIILGKRIQNLRKKQGITLEGLAYSVELSKGNLSDIENGKKNPTYLTMSKIAEGLEISLSEFFNF